MRAITAQPATLAILALTAVALALRIAVVDQSLTGDELLTLPIVSRPAPWDVVTATQDTVNPPLFFLLAWATAKLGDPTVWIRMPSVIAGAATVPLVSRSGCARWGAPAR